LSDLLALPRLVGMECLIIRLTEEETWSWRRGDQGSASLKKEICEMAKILSRRMRVPVEIQTLPEHDPQYFDDRPATLWSSNER
jgi:hypothetical protein